MQRLIGPLIFGVFGTAILVGLGLWQLDRLAWKETVLAQIEARIAAEPVWVPMQPSAEADGYLPVRAEGVLGGPELHVLISTKEHGAGYRVIQVLETESGRIMVDRGYIPLEAKDVARAGGAVTIIGNLHWPDEVDRWTPAPDMDRAIWFARDVPAMAAALGAAPVLVIARSEVGPGASDVTPLPVDSGDIPNNHLQYVITWFSLAAIWVIMTAYFIMRMRRAQRIET
ncbi:SURF1 family protein [Roseovarius sp. LXJ103]|nr:SURF1 family protein [Roseovarius carneus]PWE37352.1 SURF1 family protein [Pelagicola sp. LXJ1103]